MDRKTASSRAVVFLFTAGLMTVLAMTWSQSTASASDGVTPAVEQVCDGLVGAEFGLCNAYCEALDCDEQTEPMQSCESLRNSYFKRTGASAFPCDWSCPVVPDSSCSGRGELSIDEEGCSVCWCDPNWAGADCSTCDVQVDVCGVCGGTNACLDGIGGGFGGGEG